MVSLAVAYMGIVGECDQIACVVFSVLTRYALDRLCRSRPWATNRTKAKVLLAVFLFVAECV